MRPEQRNCFARTEFRQSERRGAEQEPEEATAVVVRDRIGTTLLNHSGSGNGRTGNSLKQVES